MLLEIHFEIKKMIIGMKDCTLNSALEAISNLARDVRDVYFDPILRCSYLQLKSYTIFTAADVSGKFSTRAIRYAWEAAEIIKSEAKYDEVCPYQSGLVFFR